jgi:hypothetical protein
MKYELKYASVKSKILIVCSIVFGLIGLVIRTSNSQPNKALQLVDSKTATQSSKQAAVKGAATKRDPRIETKTETKTETIPFESVNVDDVALLKGVTKIATAGVNGEKKTVSRLTYTDGQLTKTEKLSDEITLQPVKQVTKVGTKVAAAPKPAPAPTLTPAPQPVVSTPVASSNCDSNYSGACVPIASDVDCAGGSGNGPAYVVGPVNVIGSDVYGLDADHDGVGCE